MNIFSQPYPLKSDWKHHLRIALAISIFVTLFLLLFKPFGLGNYQHDGINFLIAGYGLITYFTLVLVYYVMRILAPIPDEEHWTTGKEILSQLVYIFVLGIANVCYTHFAFGLNFSLEAFINFQFFTLLIGVFPVSFFVIVNHVQWSQKNAKAASEMTKDLSIENPVLTKKLNDGERSKIQLTSENEKEQIELDVDDLVLIESADNYCTIYFLQNGKIENKMLRSSLKRLELQAHHKHLLRCHRTYLVNLTKVIAVTGNAQGYRLRFKGLDQTFPVSRTLNDSIREKLQQVSKEPSRS